MKTESSINRVLPASPLSQAVTAFHQVRNKVSHQYEIGRGIDTKSTPATLRAVLDIWQSIKEPRGVSREDYIVKLDESFKKIDEASRSKDSPIVKLGKLEENEDYFNTIKTDSGLLVNDLKHDKFLVNPSMLVNTVKLIAHTLIDIFRTVQTELNEH